MGIERVADLESRLQEAGRREEHLSARLAELEESTRRLTEVAQQAGRVKDDFLATLSHELRTPLNAMLGWIQLLRLHLHDPVERAHALDVLERNARAQTQIVTDLLDVSRIITGNMHLAFEPLDLTEIVRQGVEALLPTATAKRITVNVDTATLPRPAYGDRARLQQVVWNLVSNAIKFTPPGGTITVDLRADRDNVEIEVTDTGTGIAPDVLPYVFDRFRQGDSSLTRPVGGLGLGLAIVRHLVELHGGAASVRSDGEGRGSSFIVRLPMRPPEP